MMRFIGKKKTEWGNIWKTLKKDIDRDNNGFVYIEELEEVFHENFPFELEGKSLR